KQRSSFFLAAMAAIVLFFAMMLCSVTIVQAQDQPTSGRDEFFVISSIDKAHNAMILLRPTQITATIYVTPKTQFADENGKPLKLSDFRTGDTIFVTYALQPDKTLAAVSVHKGMMTM